MFLDKNLSLEVMQKVWENMEKTAFSQFPVNLVVRESSEALLNVE